MTREEAIKRLERLEAETGGTAASTDHERLARYLAWRDRGRRGPRGLATARIAFVASAITTVVVTVPWSGATDLLRAPAPLRVSSTVAVSSPEPAPDPPPRARSVGSPSPAPGGAPALRSGSGVRSTASGPVAANVRRRRVPTPVPMPTAVSRRATGEDSMASAQGALPATRLDRGGGLRIPSEPRGVRTAERFEAP